MKEKGDELVGFCPIHDTEQYSENSFSANLQKNIWHCFACGKGGNIFDFVMELKQVDLSEAAQMIAEAFKMPLKKSSQKPQKGLGRAKKDKDRGDTGSKKEKPDKSQQEQEVNKPLSFQLKNLDADHQYLKERGLTEKTIKHFGLGYCDKGIMKGRIVIPITNWKGELVAYAGRWPGDPPDNESKYKLPLGFKKHLEIFNFHEAVYGMSIEGKLIIVEGFFDCMKIWQAGFINVVAVMGAEISEEQAEFIIKTLGKDGRIINL
jgi:DNA primase